MRSKITGRIIFSIVVAVLAGIGPVYFFYLWFKAGMPIYTNQYRQGARKEFFPFLGVGFALGCICVIALFDFCIQYFDKSKSH